MKHSYSRGDHGTQKFTVMHLPGTNDPLRLGASKCGSFASNQSIESPFSRRSRHICLSLCMCVMCLSATVSFGNSTKSPTQQFKKRFQKLKNQKLFLNRFGKGKSVSWKNFHQRKLPASSQWPRSSAWKISADSYRHTRQKKESS